VLHTDLGAIRQRRPVFYQEIDGAGEKSPAVMSSKARVRLASKWPTLEIRLEERRQDRHGFIDVLRHIVVRRHTDVASSLATSERCFSALAHRGFLPGRAADYIADCFTRAQWSEARANLF